MKTRVIKIAAVILGCIAIAGSAQAAVPAAATTPADSAAYLIGALNAADLRKQILTTADSTRLDPDRFMQVFNQVMGYGDDDLSAAQGAFLAVQMRRMQQQAAKELGNEFNPTLLGQGVSDAIRGGVSAEERGAMQREFSHIMSNTAEAKNRAAAKRNDSIAARYIAELMVTDRTVKITESGLVYKVLEEGSGDPFTDDDTIDVIYTGYHHDGSTFDSSDGKPVKFSPRQVVKGFGEALKMMRPGAHYIVYIPGKLGYGSKGVSQAGIGPNEMLIFDIVTVGKAAK